MPDPSVRSVATTGPDFVGPISITWPATADGDIAYAVLSSNSDLDGNDNTAATKPAGWTLVHNGWVAGTWRPRIDVFEYVCDGTETGDTGNFDADASGSGGQTLSITVVQDGATADVVGTSNNGYGTTATANGVTTLEDGALLLAVCANVSSIASYTPPAGFTEQLEIASDRGQTVATDTGVTAGATGDHDFTLVPSPGTHWQTVLVSVPPAAIDVTLPLVTQTPTIHTLAASSGALNVVLPLVTPVSQPGSWGDVWDDVWIGHQNFEIHDLTVSLGGTAVTLPLITQTPTIHDMTVNVAGGIQSVTLPLITQTPTIHTLQVAIDKDVTLPHLTFGGYGDYQVGYGDSRIGLLTVTVGIPPGGWVFIPPSSPNVKSPTLTAEFRQQVKYSIMHHRAPKPRAVHVLKTGGTYTEYDIVDTDQIAAADVVYLGGRSYTVDSVERAELEAAGYTVTPVY